MRAPRGPAAHSQAGGTRGASPQTGCAAGNVPPGDISFWARGRTRRRCRAAVRRDDHVHPVRRAHLPAVRRRGQGGSAAAPRRRQARADGRLRGGGRRPAHPHSRARRGHRRAWRHQQRERRDVGLVQRRGRSWCSAAAHPTTSGAGARSKEMDHVPLLAPVTKRAWTEHAHRRRRRVGRRGVPAERIEPHRGPVFCDFPLEAIFGEAAVNYPTVRFICLCGPTSRTWPRISRAAGARAVLVLGSDVWLGGAEVAARTCAETLRLPVIANGQARGVLPGGHSLLVSRARSLAFRRGRPGDRGRGPAGLPAALRLVGPEGRDPPLSSTVADSPAKASRRTARSPPPRPATCPCSSPHSPRHAAHRRRATWSGLRDCAVRPAPPSRPIPRCLRARPHPSTRCASTANCCASLTMTRRWSATAATSSPSPAAC